MKRVFKWGILIVVKCLWLVEFVFLRIIFDLFALRFVVKSLKIVSFFFLRGLSQVRQCSAYFIALNGLVVLWGCSLLLVWCLIRLFLDISSLVTSFKDCFQVSYITIHSLRVSVALKGVGNGFWRAEDVFAFNDILSIVHVVGDNVVDTNDVTYDLQAIRSLQWRRGLISTSTEVPHSIEIIFRISFSFTARVRSVMRLTENEPFERDSNFFSFWITMSV